MIRIIDAERFLPGGDLPDGVLVPRHGLCIALFIEYGWPLQHRQTRETLIECTSRPKRRPCPGLLWVRKTSEDRIEVYCVICRTIQMVISNWQGTLWAEGPREGLDPTLADE